MIEPDLLSVLCCPETHQALSLAEPSLLERLNRQIAARSLQNRAGQVVTEALNEGLVRADRKFLYPIRHDIPVMLVNEAIPLVLE